MSYHGLSTLFLPLAFFLSPFFSLSFSNSNSHQVPMSSAERGSGRRQIWHSFQPSTRISAPQRHDDMTTKTVIKK